MDVAASILQQIAGSVVAKANPLTSPAAFDVFKIDTLYSPPCKVVSCNGRVLTWQEQQAPGFMGAFVVFRGQKLVTVSYGIDLWTLDGFALYQQLAAYLNASKNQRPPRGMKLTDLRLADLRIPQVALAKLPHQELVGPGQWRYVIDFQEYARLKLFGGPVQPPRNATEAQIKALQAVVDAKHKALGDAVASATAATNAYPQR